MEEIPEVSRSFEAKQKDLSHNREPVELQENFWRDEKNGGSAEF